MLAEMFFLSGKFNEALAEYRASLVSDPNRFNALVGAAHAAEELGEQRAAVKYYRAVLRNCSCATGQAARDLEHARLFVRRRAKSEDAP